MKILSLLLVVVASFGLLTACSGSDNNDVSDNANQAEDRATNNDNQTREEFETEAREQLNEIDQQLDQARARLSSETGNEREELQRRIDGLEDERASLDKKLDELRTSDKWQDVKKDIESELKELEGELKRVL